MYSELLFLLGASTCLATGPAGNWTGWDKNASNTASINSTVASGFFTNGQPTFSTVNLPPFPSSGNYGYGSLNQTESRSNITTHGTETGSSTPPAVPSDTSTNSTEIILTPTTSQATTTSSTPVATPEPTYPCDRIHVIIARGTKESSPGVMNRIAEMIKSGDLNKYGKKEKLKVNAYIHEVDYPAEAIGYDRSSHDGAIAVKNILADLTIASTCPEKNAIVMLGYGQGAQVIEDGLCGGGSTDDNTRYEKGILGDLIDPVRQDVQDRVVAVIQMSDPRRTLTSSSKKFGDAKHNGTIARQAGYPECSKETLERFQSFCDADDVLCDSGLDTSKNGTYYVDKYDKKAVEFVENQLKDFVKREEKVRKDAEEERKKAEKKKKEEEEKKEKEKKKEEEEKEKKNERA